MKNMRLDKFIADCGICTRSEAKNIIKKGLVSVNGIKALKGDIKIDTETDDVTYKGEDVIYARYEYYMLNKPLGVVSATEDKRDKTVTDLIPQPHAKDIFPVGRLDKDTEGLIIITNDGQMAHDLLSPKKHVDKTYFVKVKGNVTQSDTAAFKEGVDIGEKNKTLPAVLNIIESGEYSQCEITIHEGKFHQIKRMFKAVGKEVVYLKRLTMGGVRLDESIKEGKCRPLTKKEVEILKAEKRG